MYKCCIGSMWLDQAIKELVWLGSMCNQWKNQLCYCEGLRLNNYSYEVILHAEIMNLCHPTSFSTWNSIIFMLPAVICDHIKTTWKVVKKGEASDMISRIQGFSCYTSLEAPCATLVVSDKRKTAWMLNISFFVLRCPVQHSVLFCPIFLSLSTNCWCKTSANILVAWLKLVYGVSW